MEERIVYIGFYIHGGSLAGGQVCAWRKCELKVVEGGLYIFVKVVMWQCVNQAEVMRCWAVTERW